MHLLDVTFFLITVFAFRISKAITNEQTKEKLATANLWFNKYLENLRDKDIREVFKYFQRIFIWVSTIAFASIYLSSLFNLQIPKGTTIFITNTFIYSTILAFSVWWALNHKTELMNMLKRENVFINILLLLSPLIILLFDHYYQTGFYEIIKSDPNFPFPPNIANDFFAIILTFAFFFIFLIFPYIVSIPVYLCLYIPIKGYALYLNIVSKRLSKDGKDLLYWSVLLIDVVYGVWRFGFR